MTFPAAPPMAADGRSASCDAPRGCITCADEGVVMRVITVTPDGLATGTGPDGTRQLIDLALVAPVGPGDDVLVHAGVALVRLETHAPA